MAAVNYLWDPVEQNIVRELDDDGNVIAQYTTEPFLHGDVLNQRRNGEDSYYHFDGQGSTVALTNAAGDVTDTYEYNAFGEVTERTGSTVNPFQFIGQKGYYWDAETGEHDVRQRPLLAEYGRWLSVDPLRFTRQLANLYLYAANRPTFFVDPSGLEEKGLSDDEKTALKGCKCTSQKTFISKLPRDWLGLVYCKDDQFLVAANPVPDKSLNEEQKCGYFPFCTSKHEQHHIKQYSEYCPKECKDKACGIGEPIPTDRWVMRMGWTSEACDKKSECFAYIISISCTIDVYYFHKEGKNKRALPECLAVGISALERYISHRKKLECSPLPAELQLKANEILKSK